MYYSRQPVSVSAIFRRTVRHRASINIEKHLFTDWRITCCRSTNIVWMPKPAKTGDRHDIVLIGAGIMSATLGVLLKELDPRLKITVYEVHDKPAQESSNAWNNAGTGHAALCELNYTPQMADGTIDIGDALRVNTEFDLSRQLWSYLVKRGIIGDPKSFIHAVPHCSFVRGKDNVAYLRKRFDTLTGNHCYFGMEFSNERAQLAEWFPWIMEGRDPFDTVAATRMRTGTDVDYGALTHMVFDSLRSREGVSVNFSHRVMDITRDGASWRLRIRNDQTGEHRDSWSKFVLIGAGGGSLALLQKSGIPEAHGYGGIPVSGIWLRCDDHMIARRHHAKVYGKAAAGTPPMSVRHLDTRYVDGKVSLLFGPYSAFSTKFLQHSSYPETPKERLEGLREFFPLAREKDWRPEVAGQWVQIIKKDPVLGGGIPQFDTELVSSADRSIVAMLGASPGASTAVAIMIEVLERCFPDKLKNGWGSRLKDMIPTYGQSIIDSPTLCREIRAKTAEILHLTNV